MPDYSKGKIYKLKSDQSECFYIGSTTQSLKQRLKEHKSDMKKGSTSTHIEMENHNNIQIVLIEDFPCDLKKDLLAREAYWIRQNKDNLLNQYIPGRTKSEYREINKQAISEQRKEYRETIKGAISEYQKEYYEINKEVILERNKEYRERNKDKINERRRQRYHAKKQLDNI